MKRSMPWSRRMPAGFDRDAWTRKNSNLTIQQCRLRGVCATCGGQGGLWWSFGTEYGYTPCPQCTKAKGAAR